MHLSKLCTKGAICRDERTDDLTDGRFHADQFLRDCTYTDEKLSRETYAPPI